MLVRSQPLCDVLDKLSSDEFEAVQDQADGTCTAGFDNDGSTGLEIFENGYNLGRLAKQEGQNVVYGIRSNYKQACPGVVLFYVGTEDLALARVDVAAREYHLVEESQSNPRCDPSTVMTHQATMLQSSSSTRVRTWRSMGRLCTMTWFPSRKKRVTMFTTGRIVTTARPRR
jgi:hypothetical protein